MMEMEEEKTKTNSKGACGREREDKQSGWVDRERENK